MRSLREINDIGVRALVDALGAEDAKRFMAQFRQSEGTASAASSVPADAQELPSLTVDESHETMRDMHDPMQQQHLL